MGLTLLRWLEGKGWALQRHRARLQGPKGHRLPRAIPATHSSLKIRCQKEPLSAAYVPGVPVASPVPSSPLSMSRKLFCCDPPSKTESPRNRELLLGVIIHISGIDSTKLKQTLETKQISHHKKLHEDQRQCSAFGLLSKPL